MSHFLDESKHDGLYIFKPLLVPLIWIAYICFAKEQDRLIYGAMFFGWIGGCLFSDFSCFFWKHLIKI